LSGGALRALAQGLAESPAFRSKCDIGSVASMVDPAPRAVDHFRERDERILLGDDTAAIPDGDGYLLFAAEGMLPDFLDGDPYFAGWSSVMVNVSDVAAMGGAPLAVVDVYFQHDREGEGAKTDAVLAGMRDACAAYRVPLVGGHTTRRRGGPHALAVAILGRAKDLLTSFGARPGDVLLCAVDLRGSYRGEFPFWNATEGRAPEGLREDLALFPALAARRCVSACKDVSNAGIAGTLVMLAEASGVGARLDIGDLPIPPGVDAARWLRTFPSFGFLLAVPSHEARAVLELFRARGIACAPSGVFDDTRRVRLRDASDEALLWDLGARGFTGFAPPGSAMRGSPGRGAT
jgi:AIR synthase-related protein